MRISFIFLVLFVAFLSAAHAQVAVSPAVNVPLTACVEGRALRIVNGVPACATGTMPTVSACGTGAFLSSNASDFAGQVTIGTTLITSCTITLSKLYNNPGMGCLAQTNSGTSLALSPTVTNTATNTVVTIPLTLSISGAKIVYICFPI